MKKIQQLLFLSTCLLIVFYGCKKDDVEPEPNQPPTHVSSMEELVASTNFTFDPSKEISATLKALDNLNNPIPGARVEIWVGNSLEESMKVATGLTNGDGELSTRFKLRAYWDSLFIKTRYIGIPTDLRYSLKSNNFNIIIGDGPDKQYSSKTALDKGVMSAPIFNYLASFSTPLGVPTNILSTNDTISSAFLADINSALPERAPVPTNHPQYLSSAIETNTIITAAADVWVTFVHEGAGYRNVLAYFTYDEFNIPFTESQIDTLHIVYPNCSYLNSKGGLVSGNKVHIGVFQPGTIIGWALIANGWKNSYINPNAYRYYSITDLNPETSVSLRQHNVLLHDPGRNLFLIGFEDIKRSWAGCDNDFNDAIFYVTTNPINAAQHTNVPSMYPSPTDTDNDGVNDASDDYPNDVTKAFDNYYPGENDYGTLAFEDLWPKLGDYDFNDMVVDYRFNQIANANNDIVSIEATIMVKAVGAGYKNGFGIQLPISPSVISSVTGYNVPGSIVTLSSSNNLEAGQSKATIIAFENVYDIFPNNSAGFINTRTSDSYVQPRALNIVVNFTTPQSINSLGIPPYNPFIFVNQTRGREVHLPNYEPTDLASSSYFGTEDDNSNPSQNRYYRNSNNLPWAMHIPTSFDYPLEQTSILQGHLVFDTWVLSDGFSYMDWYLNKPQYRNTSKLYSH